MTVVNHENYYCDLFGEWHSFETYLRRYCRLPPLKERLDDMSFEETILFFMVMSQREIDNGVVRLPFSGTYAEEDRFERVCEVLQQLGDPPHEATLRRKEVNPKTSRFCRVRHQCHYSCPMCDYTCRLVVSWTPKAGFKYPDPPTCRECKDWVGMVKFRETYLPRMPLPYGYDPEPERSTAWRSL